MAYVNENIRILRNRMGLTQEKFAELMGINRKAIGAYEENRATPPLDKLNRMATLFGVSLDQLTQYRFAADAPLFEASEESPEHSLQKKGQPEFRTEGGQRHAEFSPQKTGNVTGFRTEGTPRQPAFSPQKTGDASDTRPGEMPVQAEPGLPAEKKRPFSRTGHTNPAFEPLRESAIRYVSHKYFDKYIVDADFESRLGDLPSFDFPFREEGRLYRAFDVPADSYLEEGIIIGEQLTQPGSLNETGRLLVVSNTKGIFLRKLEKGSQGEFIVKNEGREDFILRSADIREIWKPVGFFSRVLPSARPDVALPDLKALSARFNALKAQFDALL